MTADEASDLSFQMVRREVLENIVTVAGLAIIMIIAAALTLAPILVVLWIIDPSLAWIQAFIERTVNVLHNFIPMSMDYLIVVALLIIAAPFILFALWSSGSSLSASRMKLMKKEESSPVFSAWFMKKLLPFMEAEFLITIMMLVPIISIGLFYRLFYPVGSIPFPFDLVVLVGGLAWSYIILVLLFLWIPNILGEMSVKDAFRNSMIMIRDHRARIIEVWAVFLTIILLLLLPYPVFYTWMIINHMQDIYGTEPVIILQLWTIAGFLAILISVIPAAILAFTQVHLSLKEEVQKADDIR